MSGKVVERGELGDGTRYVIWVRFDGWTRCFIDHHTNKNQKRKKGTRRSMSWLKKQKKEKGYVIYFSQERG